MAIKRILPPTASAFAQTARLLRLPPQGGSDFFSLVGRLHTTNPEFRTFATALCCAARLKRAHTIHSRLVRNQEFEPRHIRNRPLRAALVRTHVRRRRAGGRLAGEEGSREKGDAHHAR